MPWNLSTVVVVLVAMLNCGCSQTDSNNSADSALQAAPLTDGQRVVLIARSLHEAGYSLDGGSAIVDESGEIKPGYVSGARRFERSIGIEKFLWKLNAYAPKLSDRLISFWCQGETVDDALKLLADVDWSEHVSPQFGFLDDAVSTAGDAAFQKYQASGKTHSTGYWVASGSDAVTVEDYNVKVSMNGNPDFGQIEVVVSLDAGP